MSKFLLRLLLFCALPLPLLLLAAHVVSEGLHRSRYLYYADWNDLYDGRINADMLVLGTSRAYVHVSPRVLDSTLHLDSYNLGMDGASFDLQYNILRLYLQHNHKPKYILQEVGYPTFVASDSVQYLHEFVAHLRDTAVQRIMQQHYPSLGIAEHYFPLYKYNDETALLKEGLLSYIGKGSKDVKYKGYEARTNEWDSTFYNFKKSHPQGMTVTIDSSIIAQYNYYLDYCKANDIMVIMFCAPTYYQAIPYITNFSQMQQLFAATAAAHHIPLLDYTADSISYQKVYFYNTQHLNKDGAERFSTKLAADVKKLLSAQP